jgi:stage V sporulation protein B
MRHTQKKLGNGAAFLGGMGIVSKLFGLVYTIACTWILQAEGMAAYMTAFPVYTFLLALSSAGLPVAISKMVAERTALGDYYAAHKVFQRALKYMLIVGLVTSALMMALCGPIANSLGRPEARLTILALGPSLFFVALISAYRGYFQGMMRMAPTAISQIIEQIVKLVVGLALAYWWNSSGVIYGAAGAIFGITVSEVVAFLYMLVLYNRSKSAIKYRIRRGVRTNMRHHIGKRMFALALPVIIGACAMPIVQNADTAIINNTLGAMESVVLMGKRVMVDTDIVKSLYGLVGYVNPIANMPSVLSMALAMSLVPAISSSHALGDLTGISEKSGLGLKYSLLVGLPCAAGLYFLATPIIHLLYSFKDPLGLNLAYIAGTLLATIAPGVLFLSILQTMTGILQGLGKTMIPVLNLFVGIAVKIVLSIVLIRIPEINIQGAFIGTTACYAVAAILDTACVIKYAKARLHPLNNIIKPVLASAAMGAVLYFTLPLADAGHSRLMPAALVLLGIVAYGIFVFLFGAVNRSDMDYIPGGRRITALMTKLRLWKSE